MTAQTRDVANRQKSPRDMEDGESPENEVARMTEAQLHRLEAVLGVNRTLHSAVAKKTKLLQQAKEENHLLRSRLDGRAVEEPARKARIEELQGKIQGTDTGGRTSKECIQFARDTARLESKIAELNDINLKLSEKHREDRARLGEQQSRLRTLAKRERELAKHLDYIATQLNDAAAQTFSDVDGEGPADFRNLPGICLNKLIGRALQHPPGHLHAHKEKTHHHMPDSPTSATPAAH
eukprot:gnl/TRDRNA2_/TRDRNA2_83970_c0_seq1.p1 gnl/TRDRNA2_/TRDRNA2_83970_c0~~gnl/TRDRNA2_/TRDRNA2_83970_c0_seq1.p1  ORF type:complete len:237 (+),score=46.95 gnl/TRDRNA2_/TRDRNA2_83970_c0_seq1:66-776(+)